MVSIYSKPYILWFLRFSSNSYNVVYNPLNRTHTGGLDHRSNSRIYPAVEEDGRGSVFGQADYEGSLLGKLLGRRKGDAQWCEYDIGTNNAQHLNFTGEEQINGFCNFLLSGKWRITLSEEPYYFITSDNPVAEWIPPRTGLIPVALDPRHLLALTPNILIETGRPENMNPEQEPVDRPVVSHCQRKRDSRIQ